MGIDLQNAALGVDGGGTRCRIALELDEVRHAVALGSANVTTDPAGAAATVRLGLAEVAGAAGVTLSDIRDVPAYLGLAGVLDEMDAAALGAELPLARARIGDDRRTAVRGALGSEDGAVVGLGTGSFFGQQRAGTIRLAGGWGARLGDKASGFWIARAALSATLDAVDGLIAQTGLSAELLARFGGRPRGIVALAKDAPAGEIAALAPVVIEAARAGDQIGEAILAEGAAYVLATLSAMEWRPGMPLCLLGGVAAFYRPYLPAEVTRGLVEAQGSALDGALLLARDARDEP